MKLKVVEGSADEINLMALYGDGKNSQNKPTLTQNPSDCLLPL